MKLYILVLLGLMFISCRQTNNSTDKATIKLKFQVIPEDINSYSVTWTDTLGQSEGYLPNNHNWITRPKEIWCVITNKENDTLGYYLGLSTAQSFAYFQTTDTIVTLNFMTGLNFFADQFSKSQTKEIHEKAAREYSKVNNLPIAFEPVYLNIKTDLRKDFEIVLKEK